MFLLYPKFQKGKIVHGRGRRCRNPNKPAPVQKKLGVFTNDFKLNYPSTAIVSHLGTDRRTLSKLHF